MPYAARPARACEAHDGPPLGRRLRASCNLKQLLALHDEVHHSREQQSHRFRQAMEPIVVAGARPHDQPCRVLVNLMKHERPGDHELAVRSRPAQHHPVCRLGLQQNKPIAAPGQRRKHGADRRMLQSVQNLFGAVAPSVVQHVVAVPSSAIGAHLNEPGPQLPPIAVHRDGVRQAVGGMGNHLVAGKREQMLARSCLDAMPVIHAALLSMRASVSARRLMPNNIFRVITNAAGWMTSIVSRERMVPAIHTRLREINRVRPIPNGTSASSQLHSTPGACPPSTNERNGSIALTGNPPPRPIGISSPTSSSCHSGRMCSALGASRYRTGDRASHSCIDRRAGSPSASATARWPPARC